MDSFMHLHAISNSSNESIWLNLNINVEMRWLYLRQPARRPGGNPSPRLSHSLLQHDAPEGQGTAGCSGTQTPCRGWEKEHERRQVRREKNECRVRTESDIFISEDRRSHTATAHNTTLTRKKATKQEAALAQNQTKRLLLISSYPVNPPPLSGKTRGDSVARLVQFRIGLNRCLLLLHPHKPFITHKHWITHLQNNSHTWGRVWTTLEIFYDTLNQIIQFRRVIEL